MDSFQSIRNKISFSFFKFAFIPTILIILSISIILIFTFEYLEYQSNLTTLQNLQKKIDQEIESLSNLLIEWVDYDSPVLYFENQYPDFVEKEILISVKNLNLQLFVSINKNNSLKEIYFFDEQGRFSQVPKNIESFFKNKAVPHLEKREDTITGILKANDTPLCFAARGVLWFKENYKISHGTLIFGRLMNKEYISKISRDINYPMDIVPISESIQEEKKFQIHRQSFFQNYGYLLLKDYFGNPIFYLKVRFYKTYTKYTIFSILAILFTLALFFLPSILLMHNDLNKKIIQRLEFLNSQIQKIKENPEIEDLFIPPKNILNQNNIDEISIIQSNFKEMLDKIKEYQKKDKLYIELLEKEREKNYNLLLNILPKEIVHKLSFDNLEIIAEEYYASVLFADIVKFTSWSKNIEPKELVLILNQLFSEFDFLTENHNIEKIKTIGDSYMAACGLPKKIENHADNIVLFALDMIQSLNEFNQKLNLNIHMRFGIHTGKVVGGVIGVKKFIFDIWGDTVNIASRIESTGTPNQIHISESTFNEIKTESLKKQFKGLGKLKSRSGHEVRIYRLDRNS
ncbi:MAG: adenylate/guanylate cyclase domain-containing protein [Leptonema sp. (in: bacteria)]